MCITSLDGCVTNTLVPEVKAVLANPSLILPLHRRLWKLVYFRDKGHLLAKYLSRLQPSLISELENRG